MNDVVPGALQRLRAPDIIREAGLLSATLGLEYSRKGAVHTTRRRGARLSGIVEISGVAYAGDPTMPDRERHNHEESESYAVAVQVEHLDHWQTSCSCTHDPATPCAHAAALLYQWVDHPLTFSGNSNSSNVIEEVPSVEQPTAPVRTGEPPSEAPAEKQKSERVESATVRARHTSLLRGPMPLGNVTDILALLSLNELRNIAREYEITPNNLHKQQLSEAILEAYKRPETVRRVVGSLEKAQRQLLAALSLAGGSMTDDELRGLFERFSLGYANQLQGMLSILQKKGLLFRTNLYSQSPTQRVSPGSSLLDVGLGWYVPLEVRAALQITLPITTFNLEARSTEASVLNIQQAKPYLVLARLLLVARSLDGQLLERRESEEDESNLTTAPTEILTAMRPPRGQVPDGAASVPPPPGRPSPELLVIVQRTLPESDAFLNFALRLLRLSGMIYRDEKSPELHILSNISQLLLGPGRFEVARDLFSLWLTQASYDELFDLQSQGLFLRCRTTPMHHLALRPGELGAENREARQALMALLAQAPLNEWINFSTFARFIYRLNPAFLQRRQRLFPSPHWWLEVEEGRPLRPTQLQDWLRAEGCYLALLLQGPLHWLGLSDTVLDSQGALQAFRLTSLAGSFFASMVADNGKFEHSIKVLEYEEQLEPPEITIEEPQTLWITCTAAAWPLLELIESFAEIAGVREGRLGYRLTPRSLSDALRIGRDTTDLFALLRRANSASEVRSTLLEQVEQWLKSYGRMRIYTGVTLLQSADAVVMRELMATTSIEAQTVQVLQPTVRILKSQSMDILFDELKRRGIEPLVHDEEEDGAE